MWDGEMESKKDKEEGKWREKKTGRELVRGSNE